MIVAKLLLVTCLSPGEAVSWLLCYAAHARVDGSPSHGASSATRTGEAVLLRQVELDTSATSANLWCVRRQLDLLSTLQLYSTLSFGLHIV